ncbi:transglycosylase domain-containing protein, partial [Pseudomonadota bacterium]
MIVLGSIASVATYVAILPFPSKLSELPKDYVKNNYVDRNSVRLNITYENKWNSLDQIKIHEVPEFLQTAFILSEDKRFYKHGGVDWQARANALVQNVAAGKIVRGASTISEQVVRMIHPRPRTLWSRWVEGFEAMLLEQKFSKPEIIEFYLNQIPYGGRRRGVSQAANYYFNRDIDTLNHKEMLALAILVRSPKWMNPEKHYNRMNQAIVNLLTRMQSAKVIDEINIEKMKAQPLIVSRPSFAHNTQHFIEYVHDSVQLDEGNFDSNIIHTTIDTELQNIVQSTLDERLKALGDLNVNNGAVLVVDHETNEILSWAVGFAGKKGRAFNQIDPIRTRRQPGSALKPFLYARTFEKGWTASTMLDDSPLEEGVGLGMHTYHNYSRGHYGMISVREALGNSLNIPAIRAIQYIGAEDFLLFLGGLGIESLSGHPNVYGDGIALGNGEVTLYELVQAYTVLARMGDYKPLSCIEGQHLTNGNSRVMGEDIASLIVDILSDPAAKEKEFGWDSILNFPYQTAVKTGTSSDYRDAWAVGVNGKYTVGVWFGNLDYSEMDEVTGSNGPAFVLRTIFNELNRNREIKPLRLSPYLEKHRVCIESGLIAKDNCEARDEWFAFGTLPSTSVVSEAGIRLRKPTNGLLLAMDPRIPDEFEYFAFEVSKHEKLRKVEWFVNGEFAGDSASNSFNWRVKKGAFFVSAKVWVNDAVKPLETETV